MFTINGELCKPIDIVTQDPSLKGYYVSIEGKVYSNKRKKLKEIKPCWLNAERKYKIIYLYSNKKQKKFYLHKLVAKAFLFNGNGGKLVKHKNGDRTDNRLENLSYIKGTILGKRKLYGGRPTQEVRYVQIKGEFDLNENLIEEIKLLHKATQIKGMNVSNDVNDFFYEIMKGAMEEYRIKYNLNKILYSLNQN